MGLRILQPCVVAGRELEANVTNVVKVDVKLMLAHRR